MRRPQVVVFERDAGLARHLDALIVERKWVLRESRQVDGCLRLLAGPGPSVLVIRLSPNIESGLTLLAHVTGTCPGVRTVAVGDPDSLPSLTGLTWDLGADFALFPPTTIAQLPAIVAGLMDAP